MINKKLYSSIIINIIAIFIMLVSIILKINISGFLFIIYGFYIFVYKKITIIKLLVLGLPFMFYINIAGIKLNASISDILLPICIIYIIFIRKKLNKDIKNSINMSRYRSIVNIYSIILAIMLCISLFKVIFTYGILSISFADSLKIMINLVYLNFFFYLFEKYNTEFEIIFLKMWNISSVVISLMCITGVILYNMNIDNSWVEAFRATGPFDDSNLAATYILISIGLISIYNIKLKSKIISYNTLLNIIALILTSSRGAYLSALISVIFIIILSLLRKNIKFVKCFIKMIIPISLILIIVIMLNSDLFMQALNRGTSSGESIFEDVRFIIWSVCIYLWKQNPILGIGIGAFYDLSVSTHLWYTKKLIAHNTYISFLVETGIIGFCVFISLPIIIVFNLIKLIKFSRNIEIIFLLFSLISVYISFISINLQNFRCIWVLFAYTCYKISLELNIIKAKEDLLC